MYLFKIWSSNLYYGMKYSIASYKEKSIEMLQVLTLLKINPQDSAGIVIPLKCFLEQF